ncbi:DedA family protein [Rhodalgimonas zhirmunskyi]|uniref:VTT domain-containing protein n=1 Tax=Rhodalgimonas zhirmunskyi TaxID=2964767 RepID=A0AAJ1X3D7_9RHOB|nr:VTT domain-containing protein [Rhodoalgimonas zhirmunskyi]MDQ2093188.1 VTT domain-containing protein [Rhodoalgimonas zhirmunskyi]
MNDWLLEQLASVGPSLLFAVTLFSCLALPVPASLMMLTAGAFVASGEIAGTTAMATALGGAILGDQIGYMLGGRAQTSLERALASRPKRQALLARALALLHRHGGTGVFLSRWLLSPLGPYVNIAAGAAAMNWTRFTLWAALGEMAWVTLYIGLGYQFSDNLAATAEFAADTSGLLAALAVMIGAGLWLRHAHRLHRLEKARLEKHRTRDLGGSS